LSDIILFQCVETCLNLVQNYFGGLLQLTNIFQHFEIISELSSVAEIILFQFQTWLCVKQRLLNNSEIISVWSYFTCNQALAHTIAVLAEESCIWMVVFQFVPKLIHVLYAAVVICSTLVNIRHTHTDSIWPTYLISWVNWAKKQVRYWLDILCWSYYPRQTWHCNTFSHICSCVCLTCLGSDGWKHWPRNFIFGIQVHLSRWC